jgi:predicted Zn-dependent protease
MTQYTADTAERVGDLIGTHLAGPWDVFAQRLHRHEVHLVGRAPELHRGPLTIEGFGLRVFRPNGDALRVGLASTNEVSRDSVAQTIARAEAVAKFASFPAKSVELPSTVRSLPEVPLVDPAVRDQPEASIEKFCQELIGRFDGMKDPVPSFGSVRATFAENSLRNSAGASAHWFSTSVEFEFAIKSVSSGGSGAPSEFWVNSVARQLEPHALHVDVPTWARIAHDMHGARPPSTGTQTVVFPPSELGEIATAILGFRMTGAARLRQLAPEPGSQLASPLVHLSDDPALPWGMGSAPVDDEGSARTPLALLQAGKVGPLAYDLLHGSKFGVPSNGHGNRMAVLGEPYRFAGGLSPVTSNLVLATGDAGSDEELMERVGEGIWLEQLGYPFPDGLGGTYGGELRAAYRIHRGKKAEPLRGGTIGGLLFGPPGTPSLLGNVTALGSVAEQYGRFTSPAVVVENIAVAGPG